MARFDKRETQRQRDYRTGIRGSALGAVVDTRDIDQLLRRLELRDKEGKKVIKMACRMALEVINEETAQEAAALNLKESGKGWRKLLTKKGSYIYRNRRNSAGIFWFYTAINYKKPILRISHLVEKGFNHIKSGLVAGNWFRKEAFRKKQKEALKRLELNLLYGIDKLHKGEKIPNLSQWRKGAPK